MIIGCLGDIVFEVSSDAIKTIDKANWSGSVKIQTHSRHLQHALTEFTGIDPDQFSFQVLLSQYLGVDVQNALDKFLEYEKSGAALSLTLGCKAYGKYRWLIKNHKIELKTFDKVGNVTEAKVTVNLVEYIKE